MLKFQCLGFGKFLLTACTKIYSKNYWPVYLFLQSNSQKDSPWNFYRKFGFNSAKQESYDDYSHCPSQMKEMIKDGTISWIGEQDLEEDNQDGQVKLLYYKAKKPKDPVTVPVNILACNVPFNEATEFFDGNLGFDFHFLV